MSHTNVAPAPARRPGHRPGLMLAGLALAAILAPPTFAQEAVDPAVLQLGKRVWAEKVRCGECHGWSGNGVPDDGRQPVGANLRETVLTFEQLREVVQCGRPGTEMPWFDARAYKDDRCYGVTAEDLGDQVPPGFGVTLIAREIDAVTTYVETQIKGRGQVTAAECNAYFGDGNEACARFGFTADEPAAAPAGKDNPADQH